MTFKSQLAIDSKNTFMNADELAEEVSYVAAGEDPRTIDAVVVREVLNPGAEISARALRNVAEIYIANHETEGVTGIDIAGDRIIITDNLGNTRTTKVSRIISVDEGMWHLEITW